MKVRALFLLAGVALLLAGGVRAADDPPKTAADTFNKVIELLKAGDTEAAAKYFHRRPSRKGLRELADALKSGEVEGTVADSREDGDLAVLVTKMVRKNPKGETTVEWECGPMIRRDGIWQIYDRIGDTKLVGTAKEKMDALYKWATQRRRELRKDSKKPAAPKEEPARPVPPAAPAPADR